MTRGGWSPIEAFIFGRRLYTWDGFHGEIEAFTALGITAALSTLRREPRSNRPAKGDEFVSDVLHENTSFLSLYEQDRVTDDRIDDFIAAWHESGDAEQRSLAEFLGMTETEYSVSLMAPNSLPLIRRARREHVPLRALLVPWLAALRETADPVDHPVIHALSHWLNKPEAA